MRARNFDFEVLESRIVGGATLVLRVRASAPIEAHAGQFLSVNVRGLAKRAYSFSNTLSSDSREFELCVRVVEGGLGSQYLASLKPGDRFEARAPFGHFVYETPPTRAVCWIASGTGVAPLRAMALSEEFRQAERKAPALALVGFRTEGDLVYAGDFEARGIREVHAFSQPQASQWIGALARTGFRGRVTDYLKTAMPAAWPWLESDYYLCGNGAMIESVRQILVNQYRVPSASIRFEAYFTPVSRVERVVVPPVFKKKAG
jgi:NAD(P)H-flavin reductase